MTNKIKSAYPAAAYTDVQPLPVDGEDPTQILLHRPGDQIYQTIKEHLEVVKTKSKEYKSQLLSIILKDMYLDLALSSAIDDAGATAEYLSQDLGVEKPLFSGQEVLSDFRRISKFKVSMEIGELLKLNEAELTTMMHSEADRLWYDPARPRAEKEDKKSQPTKLVLPDEVVSILRGLGKMAKGK